MRIGLLIVALAWLTHASVATAQYQTRSWLPWRTIETGRFTLHFPTELESWARTVAGKLGAIDTSVSRMVGFRPTQKIQIVVDDPFRIPNGSAWPLIDAPRIVLWATPPNPREDIGSFVSWADMLASHEFAHLAHLLRPTRNPWQSWLWKVAPVELGPISRKAPRWVIEGYATHIEGALTLSGRPHGAWRESILRRWALEGALPTYGQLDHMNGMYGGEFAYLAGSQFIEWLNGQFGPENLDRLWRRMSALRDRSFAEAFTGTYGEAPDVLYGRFTAQLTAEAHAVAARVRRSAADSGTLIQHLSRETGDPAISHDGGRVAITLASATRPGRVVIWRTIPEPDTLADRAARALLARDPQDAPAVRRFPPPKRALATLDAVGNQAYQDPRFFRDGRVLVWRNTAIGDGSWAPDLYIWDPQRRSVVRLTRRGNVRQGDPSPDATQIAALRCAAGTCDLVLVDVRTGGVSLLAAGSETRSFHRPRFSPDGRSVLVSVHTDGYWRLALVSLADRSIRIITRDRRNYFDGAFTESGFVATSDDNGVLNIVTLTDSAGVGALTSVTGAAVAPEVNPADGSVWYLFLHARGWDLRSAPRRPPEAPGLPRFEPAKPILLPSVDVGPTRRYSPDRKWLYFPTANAVADGAAVGLGLINTDPVGRHELMLQGSKSISPQSLNAPLEGGVVTLTSRTRVPSVISAFALRQDGPFRHTLSGGAASIDLLTYRFTRLSSRLAVGGTWASAAIPLAGMPPQSGRWLQVADFSGSVSRYRDGRRTTAALVLHSANGRRDDASISRFIATWGVSSTEIPFTFTAQLGRSRSAWELERFTLGGNPPLLAPPGVLAQYIAQPALPPFFVGEKLETYRLSVPFVGARAYAWAGRAFDGPAPQFERVLGAEWTGSIVAIPALGTPAARATVGVGRWMDHRFVLRQMTPDPAVYGTPRGKVQFYFTTQFGDWAR